MVKLENMVKVTYTVYEKRPTDDPAEGYVPAGKLIGWDSAEGQALEIWEENGAELSEAKLPDGYRYVQADNKGYYTRIDDIWTEVLPSAKFPSGWRFSYPTGGITEAYEPEADFEGTLLVRKSWN